MWATIFRIAIAALLIEASGIALLFALVAVFGPNDVTAAQAYAERLGQWVGPISGSVLCLFCGWWLTRKLPSGQVRNGLILGAAAAAVDIALLVLSGAAFQMVFVASNAARLAAGALGGWLARNLSSPTASQRGR